MKIKSPCDKLTSWVFRWYYFWAGDLDCTCCVFFRSMVISCSYLTAAVLLASIEAFVYLVILTILFLVLPTIFSPVPKL